MSKPWEIEGPDLENHLTNECNLTIHEPESTLDDMYSTTELFLEQADLDLLYQFPTDEPVPATYDGVMLQSLENETAEFDLLYECAAKSYRAVGEPFRTARFWCLRVSYE